MGFTIGEDAILFSCLQALQTAVKEWGWVGGQTTRNLASQLNSHSTTICAVPPGRGSSHASTCNCLTKKH